MLYGVTDDDFVIAESTKPTGNERKKANLKGAFVIEKFNLPEKTANTLNNIRQTKPSSGFFNTLGRLILKVVNYFKGTSDSSILLLIIADASPHSSILLSDILSALFNKDFSTFLYLHIL